MSNFIFWIVLGLILMIAEIFIPSFFIFWFGVGAVVAGLTSWFWGVVPQTIVFLVTSGVLVLLTRPLAKKLVGESPRKINVDEIVGKEALVIERIDNVKGTGVIKVNGDRWRALSENDEVIEKGKKVMVVKVEGAHVVVRRKEG
ncbi:MAG: hypothetical protein B5M49_00930 [Thermotoga sp. 4484_232]|nr:NfeD family protein [Thermotogaceae bacterium]OQX58909.1 MAG: hypothetical protein B5M49_00930 [Thermotoga sp. 4484_232]RKX41378.1 MAG: NfeD family protein [Thermotogota bacterium]RKX57106.1 MAG: NfeD family protein [Thermotoga sp.]HDG61646.1 NfeD family protein [Thermotoga sp.]